MDRHQAVSIQREIIAAVEALGTKYGLNINAGRITYDTNGFRMTLEGKAQVITAPGKATQSAVLVEMARRHGFTTEERNFKRLLDYNSRRPKYPWTYEDALSRKKFKCTHASASSYFKLAPGEVAPTRPVVTPAVPAHTPWAEQTRHKVMGGRIWESDDTHEGDEDATFGTAPKHAYEGQF